MVRPAAIGAAAVVTGPLELPLPPAMPESDGTLLGQLPGDGVAPVWAAGGLPPAHLDGVEDSSAAGRLTLSPTRGRCTPTGVHHAGPRSLDLIVASHRDPSLSPVGRLPSLQEDGDALLMILGREQSAQAAGQMAAQLLALAVT